MPALKDSPDTLTFGEAIERLKKNPDDPELQELRKTFGSFKKQFIPSQKELAAIAKSVSSIVEQSAVLQSITQVQENAKRLTTFFDSFRVNDAISQLQQAQAWQNGPTHLLSIPPSSEVETQIKLDEVNNNLEKIFKKQVDLKIGYAILQLIQNYEDIENFNKKNIYILIKELTNSRAQNITRILNKMKSIYCHLLHEYNSTGEISMKYGIIVRNSGVFFK